MHIGRMKKSAAGAVVGLCLAVGAFGNAEAADELTVPIATWGSPTHVNITQFIAPLELSLYRRTGGRISVKHYPAGQLAEDVDMPIAIPSGKVKLGWITVTGWSGVIPDVKINDTPVGLTMAQAARATELPGGFKEVLDKQFREKGATLLAITDLGPPAFVSNKKVVAPDDFKGLKVRVYSEGTMEMMRHLGAAPVKMAFAEIYTAMQRGTVDAVLTGFSGIASQRMYEVAKYALVPASFFGMGLQGWAANLQWWDSLAPEDREIVDKAIREAELICRYELMKDRATLADRYREKGMEVTILDESMPEYQAWGAAMEPLLEAAKKELSPEIFAPVEKVKAELAQSQ